MVIELLKYYLSLHYWQNATVDSIKIMQLKKFNELFEYACKHSKFYREYYGDHGVLDLKIQSLADIAKIPIVSKAILKPYSTKDIMTCNMGKHIHIHSTSGSSGEPFKIAINNYEDYTSHVRVFWALRKAGFRMSDKIVIISRYGCDDQFDVEKEISFIGVMQNKFNLFQREIISIYEPVDEIISKLMKTKARILWSTPSIMQIVGNRLREREITFDFPIVFLTSEVISTMQKGLFTTYLGKYVVSLYGAMESPSLGFDFGLSDQYTIFPNSNYFEFENFSKNENDNNIGNVIITNLINKTMPIIRYDLNDLAEIGEHPGFGCKHIKGIVGRQDDIVELEKDKYLAHHHAYEMFMDFHECEMYKFVKKRNKTILLQIKIARNQDKSYVEKLAFERWRNRFGAVPLIVEFVDSFKINPQTGKFKNIEIES